MVEAAWLKLGSISGLPVIDQYLARFKPGKPIELGALATSHILDEELSDCPAHDTFFMPDDMEYIIGHNVDYDWKVVRQPDVKRICTKALSSKLWPDADTHTQSAMIYLHYRDQASSLLRNAHAALDDVKNCRLLLIKIIDALAEKLGRPLIDWEELWTISEDARIPTVIGFGKHKGMAIADLPSDYKRWLLNQTELDPFVRKALSR
nr:3'-5' exonuclease [Pseudomonas folii]